MSSRSAFAQLFLARVREFLREPEVVFWVFGFPLILAIGLGIAFRNRPPDRIFVGIVEGAGASPIAATLEADGDFHVEMLAGQEAGRALRLGKVALVVEPAPAGELTQSYRYDPTRPDSILARQKVDDAIQRAAGRSDPVSVSETRISEPGAR
jgi:hypothetical protein